MSQGLSCSCSALGPRWSRHFQSSWEANRGGCRRFRIPCANSLSLPYAATNSTNLTLRKTHGTHESRIVDSGRRNDVVLDALSLRLVVGSTRNGPSPSLRVIEV